jgi:tetratricopeptide (TPR) repeat protein
MMRLPEGSTPHPIFVSPKGNSPSAGAEAARAPKCAAADGEQRDETISAALNTEAQFAIDSGDLDKAEVVLAEAEKTQTLAVERHALDAAKTLALRVGIALARPRFGEAVESFAAAAEILPAGHDDERFAYLNAEADAFYRQGNECRGREAFASAISRYRHIALVRSRGAFPQDWAMTQMRLGAALQTLSECGGGTDLLEDAAAAYRSALQEFTRASAPQLWAMTQMSLGTALFRIGEKEPGNERLNEAITAYREALKEYSRERAPLDWARTKMNLGAALEALGAREDGTVRLIDAIAAYREALQENTKVRAPALWAMTQLSLGNALLRLGERAGNTDNRRLRGSPAGTRSRTRQSNGRRPRFASVMRCSRLAQGKAVRRSWRKPSPHMVKRLRCITASTRRSNGPRSPAIRLSRCHISPNGRTRLRWRGWRLTGSRPRSRHFAMVRTCAPLPL